MLYEGYIASEIAKVETKLAEKKAADRWRFRHFRSRESQVLTAIVTNLLQLFLR